MTLRVKLVLPLFVIAALMAAYMHGIWIPQSLAKARVEHLVRVERHLDSVVEGLIPMLVSGQVDAIHEHLNALKARNKDWIEIELIDEAARQIYPLMSPRPATPARAGARVSVRRDVEFLGVRHGALTVLVDFSELEVSDRRRHDELAMLFGAIAVLFLLTLALTLEWAIRRPLRALARASDEMARQNFSTTLPPARADEVGALIAAFANMRYDLQRVQHELRHEIDQRTRDEAELVRVNGELADRERDLRVVTDSVGDGIIRLDGEGRVTFWNPGAARLFGVDAAGALGKDFHRHFAPAALFDRAHQGLAAFARSGDGPILCGTQEVTACRTDGAEFSAELTVARIPAADGWQAVGVVRDVSERKRIESELDRHRDHLEELVVERTQEVEEKNASLQKALELVQKTRDELISSEKMASLGRLVAGFAHEINTPIGVAVGATTFAQEALRKLLPLLDGDEIDELVLRSSLGKIDEACRLANNNLGRAADLVGRFKRTSVDQTRGVARLYNLRETLLDIVASLHDVLKRTSVAVTVDCAEDIRLFGQPGALGQIVTNLLMNSLKHGFDDGRRAGEVSIRAAVRGEQVVLRYRDNGKGMSVDTRARAFEPFFTMAGESGGTGLGLFICHNLATAELKGGISCEAPEGDGVAFVLHFPATTVATVESADA